MKNTNNAIEIDNVSMAFIMQTEKTEHLKEYFIKRIKGQIAHQKFEALKDVSLDIQKGDVFGLVGLNGSGKSTLLKMVSGILAPTSGKITTHGSVAPLIELGAGFDMELTARENIFLNGSVLGIPRGTVKEKFDEVVDFSELHDFLDVPMKNYSSGMVARIGFAMATIIKPDILIVDEILGVGDFKFQEKCEQRINYLMSGGTTVLMVSHSIEQIERLCNKAAWLNKGRLVATGAVDEICEMYKSQA